jgi:hypothetical protein
MDPQDPSPGHHAHVLLHDADDRILDGMVALNGAGVEGPLAFTELRHLGGAAGRPDAGGGALDHVPGQYCLSAVGSTMSPRRSRAPAALEAVVALGGPQAAGAFPNFAESATAEELHPAPVLARLRAIKAAVDPEDRIQANHPV